VDPRLCSQLINEVKSVPDAWKVSFSGSSMSFKEWSPYSNHSAYEYDRDNPDYADYQKYLDAYEHLDGGISIDYCLSEPAEPHCKLHYVLPIAILVTILNLFKAVAIFYTAFGTQDEPILTMGDAVACFLEEKDPTTKGMCLLSVHDVKKSKDYFPVGAREWAGEQRRWKDVTSLRRRITTILM
jgi:hypothetical protein